MSWALSLCIFHYMPQQSSNWKKWWLNSKSIWKGTGFTALLNLTAIPLRWFRACLTMTQKWSEYRHLRTFPGVNGNHTGPYMSYTRRCKPHLQWGVISKTMNLRMVMATESVGAPNSLHTHGRIWNQALKSRAKDQSKGLIEVKRHERFAFVTWHWHHVALSMFIPLQKSKNKNNWRKVYKKKRLRRKDKIEFMLKMS